MSRKTIVSIIALIYMALGLVSFCTAWVPSSSLLLIFDWFQLIGGALAAYAGFAMFRLMEIGRKLVVILLSIRVLMNTVSIVQVWRYGSEFVIMNRFGEISSQVVSPYVAQAYFLAWIVMAILLIAFLSQAETRAIFTSEVIEERAPESAA